MPVWGFLPLFFPLVPKCAPACDSTSLEVMYGRAKHVRARSTFNRAHTRNREHVLAIVVAFWWQAPWPPSKANFWNRVSKLKHRRGILLFSRSGTPRHDTTAQHSTKRITLRSRLIRLDSSLCRVSPTAEKKKEAVWSVWEQLMALYSTVRLHTMTWTLFTHLVFSMLAAKCSKVRGLTLYYSNRKACARWRFSVFA